MAAKGKNRLLLLAAVTVFGTAAFVLFPLFFLPSVKGLKDRKANLTTEVRDWKGHGHPFTVGPKNRYWTTLTRLPEEMKWAVVVAEDGRFFEHEGVDYQALQEALKYDLEKKRLARGASTITQQLAKNLFLSREKTLTRKVREIVLARRLEQELTKGRILELYLNVVELGPMVHGVGHGARYYFGKPASALTPRECAFLAAMLPGPRVAFNPYRNLRKVEKYAERILLRMRQRGVLSEGEYRLAIAEELNIAGLERKVARTLEVPPPPEPQAESEIAAALDVPLDSGGLVEEEAVEMVESEQEGEASPTPAEDLHPSGPDSPEPEENSAGAAVAPEVENGAAGAEEGL